ncbi:helix-turn-helix domain-containing protein [Rhodobacteraceae bacterium M385]|nr:helix-turn-helix domain-containing protein [Rhodobacteraceae bacterium M385]
MGKSKKDGEGQYVPLSYAQLKCAAWRNLSGAAVKLWLELHTRYNGGNNGALTLSYAEAGEALGMGKATVQRAYAELVAKGFLSLEREGNWYHRRAHEWRLTTKPVQRTKGKQLATNDWRNFKPP